MKHAFKMYFWLIVVVAVAAGAFVGGFTFGANKGRKQGQSLTEAQLRPLVDYAFPKPPEEMRSLTGIVKNIYGAEITLEVGDPNDYLPRLDGTPRATQVRKGMVSSGTQIVFIDMTKFDKNGNAARTPLKLSDLKNGDQIAVFATQNIRNVQEFEIARIELVQY